jgi:hypothetical protein
MPATSAAPKVTLAINGSTVDWDHVALMNPGQPIPMVVTLQGAGPGVQQVQLSVPSGMSALSQTVVNLVNGGSVTVWLTPLVASTLADNIVVNALIGNLLVGNAVEMNVKVTMPEVITAADTPAQMTKAQKYRIPPSVPTPVKYTLSADPPPGSTLWVAVQGNSDLNGRVGFSTTFYGVLPATTLNAKKGTLNLVGTSQTQAPAKGQPSNAGKLHLQVYTYDAKEDKFFEYGTPSAGFSVAAIPLTITLKYAAPVEGKVRSPYAYDAKENTNGYKNDDGTNYQFRWGAIYTGTITSDSGAANVRDLDQVTWNEKLSADGPALTGAPEEWLKVADGTAIDIVAKRISISNSLAELKARKDAAEALEKAIKGGLTLEAWSQAFVFTDARTGVTKAAPAVVPNSGFKLEQTFEEAGGKYTTQVRRLAVMVDFKDDVRKAWEAAAGGLPRGGQQIAGDHDPVRRGVRYAPGTRALVDLRRGPRPRSVSARPRGFSHPGQGHRGPRRWPVCRAAGVFLRGRLGAAELLRRLVLRETPPELGTAPPEGLHGERRRRRAGGQHHQERT